MCYLVKFLAHRVDCVTRGSLTQLSIVFILSKVQYNSPEDFSYIKGKDK